MRNSFFGHTLARSSTATDLQIQKTKTSAQYSEYIRNLANSIERIYSQFSRFNSEYLINLQFHRRVRQSMYFLLHCCVGILKPVYVQDHLFVISFRMISEHNATTDAIKSHKVCLGVESTPNVCGVPVLITWGNLMFLKKTDCCEVIARLTPTLASIVEMFRECKLNLNKKIDASKPNTPPLGMDRRPNRKNGKAMYCAGIHQASIQMWLIRVANPV